MFQIDRYGPGINGWHSGERAVQRIRGVEWEVAEDSEIVRSYLPDQQRAFHSRDISFLPFASRSPDGRVWASLLVGNEGQPGFISSPTDHVLTIRADTWEGDPIRRTIPVQGSEEEGGRVAGVGVELTSRRRNKLAGRTARVEWNGDRLEMDLEVNQTCGNCPKYIQIRRLVSHPSQPRVVDESLTLNPSDTLPPSLVAFIKSCDTLFLGTSYLASPSQAAGFPSHLGMNHRGGRPGFVRVRSDGRTLVLQDYSGNRFFSSLGNIERDPVAGLVIPNFATGDVLYLTCQAHNLFDAEAEAIMPRAKCITLLRATGYTFVENALPFREAEGTLELSPYDPPIRYLAEEKELPTPQDALARLSGIALHSSSNVTRAPGLATFTFTTSHPISYKAGQYAILDTLPLIGEMPYVHMNKGDEKSPNEDGVRTWTISSSPSSPTSFSLTIRHIPRGRVTSRLFTYASQHLLHSFPLPSLELPLLGIGGSFILPRLPTKMLWIAGGIGVTPFLAFAGEMAGGEGEWEVEMLAATREPEVIAQLVRSALGREGGGKVRLRLQIHFFSDAPPPPADFFESLAPGVVVTTTYHTGRIGSGDFARFGAFGEGQVFLCGPPEFEKVVLEGLGKAGVQEAKVTRESFDY